MNLISFPPLFSSYTVDVVGGEENDGSSDGAGSVAAKFGNCYTISNRFLIH